MNEIIDAEFYEERLRGTNDPRNAVWAADERDYERVAKESTEICLEYVKPRMDILDAGCGIGELTECLPQCWLQNMGHYGRQHTGLYLGIDFCDGFIKVAKKRYPNFSFAVWDLLDLDCFSDGQFNLAICRTVQGVAGDDWEQILRNLTRVARKVLVFRAMLKSGETLKTVEVYDGNL